MKRVIAAAAAIILAAVGVILVLAYANRADERALEGLDTVPVLVATAPIAQGTSGDALDELVEVQQVPQDYVVEGAFEELEDIEGLVVADALTEGEQLREGRLLSEAELRARDDFDLPEEAEDLHQVTIPLDRARALGGNIAAGDTVGVFMSFEPEDQEEQDAFDLTTLELNKALVIRVAGGYVAPPVQGPGEDDGEQAEPEDNILVTLALDAPDAEELVFAMEFGTVWLSYEPEEASEDGTGTVVLILPLPDEVRDVLQ
nr:Flp pilus assembly protein CpaB [Ornithinimicrobium sediminis]